MIRLFLLLLTVFALACSLVSAQDDPAEAILNVLAERPYVVSLVVCSLDDPEGGLYHNANVKRPLASIVRFWPLRSIRASG